MPPKRVAKSAMAGKKAQKQNKPPKADTNETKRNEKKAGSTSETDKSTTATNQTTSKKNQVNSNMTLCTIPTISTKPTRRPGRPPSAKTCMGPNRSREISAKVRSTYRRSLDPCDNSNDSGIDFDHHMDPHHHTASMAERLTWSGERAEAKRPKLDIKLENEEANDYSFPETTRSCKDNTGLIRTVPVSAVPSLNINNNPSGTSERSMPRCIPLSNRQPSVDPVPLTSQLLSSSRYLDVSLTILKQPEQQHRARYQTEGSRGAVKDREGNGFPVVQLTGYYKPAMLQVFIGTDVGKVSPHMFYQACKVSGKNSTPCAEKKIDGTCVIELQLDPSKEMSATCDCVGILKERNVDVEHRFPDQLGNRSKKKSTRCRMIFRTTITLDDGSQETLQVCSQPIVCTQPPGVPEICKKSLTSCPASGGLELFVLGKNFLKDTKVFFQQYEDGHVRWEQSVVPDKEYLQQTHFVCVIPPYRRPDITEPITVRLCVVSSGKTSESHQFVYTPVNGAMASVHVDPPPPPQPPQFFKSNFWQSPITVSKREKDLDMMPPPESSLVPISSRRPSISLPSSNEVHSPPLHTFKQEYVDENSQGSLIEHERYRHISESSLDVHHSDSNISLINENSMDMLNQNSMMSHENSNISVGNEESVEMMVRRNSMSRPSISNEDSVEMMMRRNSMNRQASSTCDSSCDNSNLSTINEDSSLHSMVQERTILRPLLSTNSTTSVEKVMDLRMKMPIGTVADLVNTTAPSMAALQRFGIVENSIGPLPTQSAQSVENYLTKIEAKPSMIPLTNPTGLLMKNDLSEKLTQIMNGEQGVYQVQKIQQAITGQSCNMLSHNLNEPPMMRQEPIFLNSVRPLLPSTTQHEIINNIVEKSERANIPPAVSEQSSTVVSTMTTTLTERSVPTPINTERLDALVNSTVESHLSPTRNDHSPKHTLLTSNVSLLAPNTNSNVMISSQDVMLNTQTNLMVPPLINTRMASPVLGTTDIANNHTSPSLTPEVILNSQISPSLMCRNAKGLQEPLLPTTNMNICQSTTAVDSTLLSATMTASQPLLMPSAAQTSLAVALTSEPEKAVLFKAAVDLLETQQKISELGTTLPSTTTKCDMLSIGTPTNENLDQLQTTANSFVQPQFAPTINTLVISKDQKSDFMLPISIKDIASTVQNDKKNEDRMIPQSFTSLTENELINFINPSCFDQV